MCIRDRQGLPTHGRHPHSQQGLAIDAAARDPITGHFRNGKRLPREHRLVDMPVPFLHTSVGGQLLSGAHHQQVAHHHVVVGDLLVVRPGEQLPSDACVEEGHGHVNESMLTGEPLPVPKVTGDRVTGGSINGEALLRVRVTAVGGQTLPVSYTHLTLPTSDLV